MKTRNERIAPILATVFVFPTAPLVGPAPATVPPTFTQLLGSNPANSEKQKERNHTFEVSEAIYTHASIYCSIQLLTGNARVVVLAVGIRTNERIELTSAASNLVWLLAALFRRKASGRSATLARVHALVGSTGNVIEFRSTGALHLRTAIRLGKACGTGLTLRCVKTRNTTAFNGCEYGRASNSFGHRWAALIGVVTSGICKSKEKYILKNKQAYQYLSKATTRHISHTYQQDTGYCRGTVYQQELRTKLV